MRNPLIVNRRTHLLGLAGAAALAVVATFPAAVRAESADPGASTFLQSLGDRAIAAFSAKSDMAAARRKFHTLLTEGFDIPYIGRWVLGRYWKIATPAQQAEYQRLFEKMIVETYAGRFAEYSGETFKITGAIGESPTDTTVSTQIVRPNGPPLGVDWRVRKTDAAYKIIDVKVEGVSMGITQRDEFKSILTSKGDEFEGLLSVLRAKVNG